MPKRHGHLWGLICTQRNALRAARLYNSHRPVKLRRELSPRVAARIAAELLRGSFEFGEPRLKKIHENGKERQLRIPCYSSIIAQTMILNVIGPILDKAIHDRSFSSRKGYGMHLCAKRQARLLHTHKERARYCLYFDLKKCYDHIRHEDVLEAVGRKIKDPHVLDAVGKVLASAGPGLPIGFPGSHTFCNLLLSPLYYQIRGIKGIEDAFVYMDNFTIYARHKAPLHRAQKLAAEWLTAHGMKMKTDWQIFPTASRPVHTCGFLLYPNRPPRLYRGLFHRIMRNVDRFAKEPTPRLARSLASRLGWLLAISRPHLVWKRINPNQLKKACSL